MANGVLDPHFADFIGANARIGGVVADGWLVSAV